MFSGVALTRTIFKGVSFGLRDLCARATGEQFVFGEREASRGAKAGAPSRSVRPAEVLEH